MGNREKGMLGRPTRWVGRVGYLSPRSAVAQDRPLGREELAGDDARVDVVHKVSGTPEPSKMEDAIGREPHGTPTARLTKEVAKL